MGSIHLVLLVFLTILLASCQSASIDCTFQYDLCGWQSEPPWLLTDRTFLPSLLNLSPVVLVGDNAFMTAQGYFGSNSTADLISPVMPPSSVVRILSFKYTKTIGDANLQIMIKDGSMYRNLDTITTNSLVFWIRRSLVVPTTLEPYQIVFRVSRLRTGFDVISIDDVMLRTANKAISSADNDLKTPLALPLETRETRRSPTTYRMGNVTNNLKIKTQCSLVKCSFRANSCFWTFENWKLLNGKIVTESQPKAWLSTEPVLLPMNAHFELDVISSESAIISVHQRFGNDELLIWTQSGLTLVGWNRIRLPTRFSPLPSRLLIRTSTRHGQFVAITNTNIVDESGRDLACGGDMLVIRPRSDEVIRLTAMQKLDSSHVEASSIPTLFMVSTSTTTVPSLPSAPRHQSPIISSFSLSSPGHAVPSSFATLPISPAQVSSSQHLSAGAQGFRARPTLFSASSSNTTRISPSISRNRTTLPIPISAITKTTPSVQNLLASLKGQPIFDGQLKYLAKKFGFDRMSDDDADAQRYSVIQRMLSALHHIKTTSVDQKPISPTNTKDTEGNVLPEELSKFASSILPSSQTINGALTNKISQFLTPPRDLGDDSKPFSRNNMDFVVENAYNAYVNHARP